MDFKEFSLFFILSPFFFVYSSNPHFIYSVTFSLNSCLKNREVVKDLKLNEYVSNLLDLN